MEKNKNKKTLMNSTFLGLIILIISFSIIGNKIINLKDLSYNEEECRIFLEKTTFLILKGSSQAEGNLLKKCQREEVVIKDNSEKSFEKVYNEIEICSKRLEIDVFKNQNVEDNSICVICSKINIENDNINFKEKLKEFSKNEKYIKKTKNIFKTTSKGSVNLNEGLYERNFSKLNIRSDVKEILIFNFYTKKEISDFGTTEALYWMNFKITADLIANYFSNQKTNGAIFFLNNNDYNVDENFGCQKLIA